MIRGFYTAASGMITNEKKMNAYSNNMANVSTVGYKKDNLVEGTFGEHLAIRMNRYQISPHNNIGEGVYMNTVVDKYVDYEQGGFLATDRNLDMAISGEGFFVIDTGEELLLTRDGQFVLDAEGYLTLPGFGRVQGENGDIQLENAFFAVDGTGRIWMENLDEDDDEEYTEGERLMIVVPDDPAEMRKDSTGMYRTDNYTQVEEDDVGTRVLFQNLERSNVNMTEEMTRMIASQRSFQSASQILRMYDDMNETANSRISRL